MDAASQDAFAEALRGFVDGGARCCWSRTSSARCSRWSTRAVVVHHGAIVHDGPVPAPAGHHADPDHDHVHPHAPFDLSGLWSAP